MDIILKVLPWAAIAAAIIGIICSGYVKAPPDTAFIISGFCFRTCSTIFLQFRLFCAIIIETNRNCCYLVILPHCTSS